MPYANLRELYANSDQRLLYRQVRLPDSNVLILPRVNGLGWSYSFGRVPTASISFDHEFDKQFSPSNYNVLIRQRVEIWVGLRDLEDETEFSQIVFSGHIDSPSRLDQTVTLECVGYSKALEVPKRGELITLDGSISAQNAVIQLLQLAGIQNYYVNLPSWFPGECCAEPIVLADMTIGEAINQIAMVDGSAWYEMPSGQIRVDDRSPIPAETSERTYHSEIPNSLAGGGGHGYPPANLDRPGRPRILPGVSWRVFPQEFQNRITVRGATCVEEGPNGETENLDVSGTADDPDSPFLPECPLPGNDEFGEDIPFPTIDCPEKAASTALRYLDLRNRLVERVTLPVPLDPTLFLGLTAQVEDPAYSEVTGNWFLEGYSCSIGERDARSDLQLLGGQDAGTVGDLSPWADFHWKKPPEIIPTEEMPPAPWNEAPVPPPDGGNCADPAAICQAILDAVQDEPPDPETGLPVMPEVPSCCPVINDDKEIVDENSDPPADGGAGAVKIRVGFHAEASRDFDGSIVSYAWSDSVSGSIGSGVNLYRDYDLSLGSVEVTLTVTDNDANTASKTKTVYLTAASPDPTDAILVDGGDQVAEDCVEVEDCVEPLLPVPFAGEATGCGGGAICDTNPNTYPIPIFGWRNSPPSPFGGVGPGVPILWSRVPPQVLLWHLEVRRLDGLQDFPNTDNLTGGFLPRPPFIGFDTGGYNFTVEGAGAVVWDANGRTFIQGDSEEIVIPEGDGRITVFVAYGAGLNVEESSDNVLVGGACDGELGQTRLWYCYGGARTKWFLDPLSESAFGGMVGAYTLNLECVPGVEVASCSPED